MSSPQTPHAYLDTLNYEGTLLLLRTLASRVITAESLHVTGPPLPDFWLKVDLDDGEIIVTDSADPDEECVAYESMCDRVALPLSRLKELQALRIEAAAKKAEERRRKNAQLVERRKSTQLKEARDAVLEARADTANAQEAADARLSRAEEHLRRLENAAQVPGVVA